VIYVMHHVARNCDPYFAALRLQRPDIKIFTSTDESYKTKGCNLFFGVEQNYLDILAAPDTDNWKIIMANDLSVEPGQFDTIDHILQFAPLAPVTFYNPTNTPYLTAWKQGHHILKTRGNWWTQCHAFPTKLIPAFLTFAEKHLIRGRLADDGMVIRFMSALGIWGYAVIPSLVQHLGFDKSILGLLPSYGKFKRMAASYTPGFDYKAVNWNHHFANPFIDWSVWLTHMK